VADDLRPPYRIAFDNARDPYTARNALGLLGTGAGINSVSPPLSVVGGILTINLSGYAPVGAEYITSVADATLTAERVLTDTATVTWNRATAGQIKASTVSEFVQANKTTSSGALTAAVIGTYHSTSLTAGDWDVWVHSTVTCAGGSGSGFELELTTGASLSGNNLRYVATTMSAPGAGHTIDIPPVQFVLASTTTINLNYRAGVTGCSISNAYIAARRRS